KSAFSRPISISWGIGLQTTVLLKSGGASPIQLRAMEAALDAMRGAHPSRVAQVHALTRLISQQFAKCRGGAQVTLEVADAGHGAFSLRSLAIGGFA
ncbi:hypothetical protein, partial [Dyella ginsengisoli]|uniref:hypothetical protein n=1 Tax=Dyella ginsengisoli TaxID=363848 RepID=UPI0019D71D79